MGEVVVILNTDEWLIRKKGFIFQCWDDRAAILSGIKGVKTVVKAHDGDGTVCENLMRMRPDAFLNGGDRGRSNTPENKVCAELGIALHYGIGGYHKLNASSIIAGKDWVERKWGKYRVLSEGESYKVKILILNPYSEISLQYHNQRTERWCVVEGQITARIDDQIEKLLPGQQILVPTRATHQIKNERGTPAKAIEIQMGNYLGEDDIVRI